MNTKELSKTLSWLLRHGANEAGVPMDEAGWVPITDVLRYMRISQGTLDEVVETNNKNRLECKGDRIRACQGHSTENMPVTLEALETAHIKAIVDRVPSFADAARVLGIDQATLYRKRKKHGLDTE